MEVFLHLLPLIGSFVFTGILIHAIFWGMTFTVDEAYLRVRVYGRTVRKIALSDVEWAAQDWCFWNEHYTNTVNLRSWCCSAVAPVCSRTSSSARRRRWSF